MILTMSVIYHDTNTQTVSGVLCCPDSNKLINCMSEKERKKKRKKERERENV